VTINAVVLAFKDVVLGFDMSEEEPWAEIVARRKSLREWHAGTPADDPFEMTIDGSIALAGGVLQIFEIQKLDMPSAVFYQT
jgi:hypothetical protein